MSRACTMSSTMIMRPVRAAASGVSTCASLETAAIEEGLLGLGEGEGMAECLGAA